MSDCRCCEGTAVGAGAAAAGSCEIVDGSASGAPDAALGGSSDDSGFEVDGSDVSVGFEDDAVEVVAGPRFRVRPLSCSSIFACSGSRSAALMVSRLVADAGSAGGASGNASASPDESASGFLRSFSHDFFSSSSLFNLSTFTPSCLAAARLTA